MENVSLISFLAIAITLIVNIAGLPVDLPYFAIVNSEVNATGISQSTTPNDFTVSGARGIQIIPPVLPADVQYFAINSTTGTQDPLGSVLLTAPGSILVNCTVASNAAGEPNWIEVNFNETGTNYYAGGDAKAAFGVALLSVPTVSSTGPTTGSRKRQLPAAVPPVTTVTGMAPILPAYNDFGEIDSPTAIVDVFCPSSVVPDVSGATGGSGSGSRRRDFQFRHSRFDSRLVRK